MCLRLYINGDRQARDTHMSLFFVIMRGEYDDQLRWPFTFKATFSLIDQLITDENGRHISESFLSDATPGCCQPRAEMNDAVGIPMFIPLDLLKKDPDRYVKNDTMYIRVQFDLLAEKSSKSC